MTSSSPRVTDPIVVEHRVGAGSAEIELVVPRELDFLRGHFPGAPVVPGVVQIKWAIALAQRYLAVGDGFTSMENVKFQRALTPESRVTLVLEYSASNRRLRFSFASAEARYSSGRVVLGTPQ
jgi:3-hydroxymyristoyl/3-hydroxydecanoyl-(acyl carrier protein) dehydratase